MLADGAMIMRRVTTAVASLVALLCFCSFGTAATPEAKFIWLSDLHFDPTANPELVDALSGADVEEWPRILNSGADKQFSHYGQDTNWALLASSLDAIRKTASDAQFTIVTGDVLAHDLRDKFQKSAKEHDDASFGRFIDKTMAVVAGQLAAIVPGKPVLFTLGNNDSACGDYELQPRGSFLKNAEPWIAKLLGPLGDSASESDWTALGSYSVPHPALQNYRVIAVDSTFLSPKYKDACGAGQPDPGAEEMQWLERKLAEAKTQHKKVWLIFHIPPGIDGYASSHPKHGAPPNQTVGMWNPAYTADFENLLKRYRNTVTISFAGHEHTDDFRLIDRSVVLMTPGVSPLVGQNPAFRVVTFGTDGTISDESTYYLSNLDKVNQGVPPEWKLEYSFAQAWGVPRLDFKSFRHLYREVETKPDAEQRWFTFYSVSHAEGNAITKQTFPWVFCASGNADAAKYRTCVAKMRK